MEVRSPAPDRRSSDAGHEAARERARQAASSVDGWLNEVQGAALFDAAAGCRGRGAIVEIGSWKGRSTIWLAYGARLAGQVVFAVDPHANSREDPSAQTLNEFSKNIREAGVADVVKPLVMTGREAARVIEESVELLFIDGDHSDAGAEEDATVWLPRLVEAGTVLMHDVATASYTGPRNAFRHHVCWNSGYAGVRRVGSMGVARRVARRSIPDALRGTVAGLLLYLLDAKRLLRRLKR
jgi:predicted O-methyltransferase YrrM